MEFLFNIIASLVGFSIFLILVFLREKYLDYRFKKNEPEAYVLLLERREARKRRGRQNV